MLNLVTLVLQISVVLVACRLVGELFLKIRQPRVNDEMFAGILPGLRPPAGSSRGLAACGEMN